MQKYLFIFFSLKISFAFTLEKKLEFSQAKQKLEYTLNHTNRSTFETVDTYVYKWGKKEFTTDREWILFLNLCEKTINEKSPENKTETCFIIGKTLSENKLKFEAYRYLMKAKDQLENSPNKKIDYYIDFHECLGNIYFYFNRDQLAKKHCLLALKGSKITPIKKIQLLNSIALVYKKTENYSRSKIYLNKALKLAKKHNIQEWIGILSGNQAQNYLCEGDTLRAKQYLQIDFEISKKHIQWESAIPALMSLTEIELESDISKAKRNLELLKVYQKEEYTDARIQAEFNRILAIYFEKTKQYEKAYTHQKKFEYYNDIQIKKTKNENILKLEFQLNFHKKQEQYDLLKIKKERYEITLVLILFIIITVSISLFIIIRQVLLRRKKEKEILIAENNKMEVELLENDQRMSQIISNLIEKNDLINNLHVELNEIKDKYSIESQEAAHFDENIDSIKILTEDDWDEFRKLFVKKFPSYIDRVSSMSDAITKADIRLACLIKLDMSNNEIGKTLGISVDSVKRTHLRLRNKLNLKEQKDLDSLLKSIN